MRSFDRNGQLRGRLSRARRDPMDGAADPSSDDRAPLWSLSGLIDHVSNSRSTVPSSPPVLRTLATELYQHTIGTAEWSPRIQSLQPLNEVPDHISQDDNATNTESIEHQRLMADNAELAQALLDMDKELNAAEQATRGLAAWTINERTRLMTEASHQRLLGEEYETILRQRDEQVIYLLERYQEVIFNHTQMLGREGEVMGRGASRDSLMKINKMRSQVGLPQIDQCGTVMMLPEKDVQHGTVQEFPWANYHITHEGQTNATVKKTQWDRGAQTDNMAIDTKQVKQAPGQYVVSEVTKEDPGLKAPEQGEAIEDEEGIIAEVAVSQRVQGGCSSTISLLRTDPPAHWHMRLWIDAPHLIQGTMHQIAAWSCLRHEIRAPAHRSRQVHRGPLQEPVQEPVLTEDDLCLDYKKATHHDCTCHKYIKGVNLNGETITAGSREFDYKSIMMYDSFDGGSYNCPDKFVNRPLSRWIVPEDQGKGKDRVQIQRGEVADLDYEWIKTTYPYKKPPK
ncbi:uncharacterized protein M421DRAFT_399145 [Didymella exigua CBS 183.55]|uniref:Uncharacterized protein n=1 Tax=Didymella exigua CBS 183.55 TaxID=1150837 RepID=A0A6A5RW43_9PLEO|nr:uncharacterized protein M421DRAFT_399145 [Didymella exigua CBS 183.55]KAF1932715.1 hypothetical protein M421DRAFT_399145 [Didymella exigua CBS 183.55]